MIRTASALLAALWATLLVTPTSAERPPIRGLTAATAVAEAYDAILDADFESVAARLPRMCALAQADHTEVLAPPEACRMLEALSLWWEISLDPGGRRLDRAFSRAVEHALEETRSWTAREPERAEAWFYLGAAYGARVQWRVLRRQHLAAARDGKRIKEALERALILDPELHDANFGIGMYRYYAAVAPRALKMLRWLFLLPGGNRTEGLRQMIRARDGGKLVRGEADYQLHLIYLWYEKRFREATELVESLQAHYPRNPLFRQLEAEIRATYFHDPKGSLAASRELLALAEAGGVHRAALASAAARLNIAVQLDRLGDTRRAVELLRALVDDRPQAPFGTTSRAETLLREIQSRERR